MYAAPEKEKKYLPFRVVVKIPDVLSIPVPTLLISISNGISLPIVSKLLLFSTYRNKLASTEHLGIQSRFGNLLKIETVCYSKYDFTSVELTFYHYRLVVW